MSIPCGRINGKLLKNEKVSVVMPKKKGLTPLAVFIEEQLDRLNISQQQLESLSGIPDSTIGRIRAGQEPKPSQLARLAKVFGCQFWYILQRAGYVLGDAIDPGAEAQRLGAIFATDPELRSIHDSLLRLSLLNRRAVVTMIQVLLEGQSDPPDPPEAE